jgi:hypothetical protein
VIIIEGVDGTGKTTLANKIIDKLLLPYGRYCHLGPPSANAPWPAWAEYMSVLQMKGVTDMIFDRLMFGEAVYGPIVRQDHRMTFEHLRMLQRVTLGHRGVLVVCKPPYEVAKKNWAARQKDGKELLDKEKLFDLAWHKYYTEVLCHTELLPVVVDPFSEDLEKMLPRILGHRSPINRGPGIGWFGKGNILLVGDQVNPNTGVKGWPFVSEGGCSLWLAQQLQTWGISERELYWINAHQYDEAGQLKAVNGNFVEELWPRKIIALGNEAAKWCRNFGFGFEQVDHPQYWKRFQAGTEYPLRRLLT